MKNTNLRRYDLLNSNGELLRTIVAPSRESCSRKIEAFYGDTAPFVKIGKSKKFTLPETSPAITTNDSETIEWSTVTEYLTKQRNNEAI
jgi:hypothetical protein